MNGTLKTLRLDHLSADDRQQRAFLGVILLILNFWRTEWQSAGLPDYLATVIQLELIITGILGWCPFIAYKVYRRNKNEKI